MRPFGWWRPFFVLSALLMLAGGPRHPGGTMAEMLAHPDWVWSHALVLAGFVTLVIGLILYSRSSPLPLRTRRWTRFATIGTALQAVEMAFHTAASVDQAHLMAGNPTPMQAFEGLAGKGPQGAGGRGQDEKPCRN